MKYIKQTLLYFKSNVLLLPAIIAACALIPLVMDFTVYDAIAESFRYGLLTPDFYTWFRMFFIFNLSGVHQAIISVLAYVGFTLLLGYVHSIVDKHIRFGMKSFKSILNGINGTAISCAGGTLLFFVCHAIVCSVMAAIMSTFCLIQTPYAFIVGAILCFGISIVSLFVMEIFFLWFPCLEITGFRAYEALNYSYSLCHKSMGNIFVSIALPVLVISGITTALPFVINVYVTAIIVSALLGLLVIYLAVLEYIIYVNEEGITREDLRKY